MTIDILQLRYSLETFLALKLQKIFNFIYQFKKNDPNVARKIYYEAHLWETLNPVLNKNLNLFLNKSKLPSNYGHALSERAVEIPWAIANIPTQPGKHYDAGSSLNFYSTISHPQMNNKQIYISNINPERYCFWQNSVSYLYLDLRQPTFHDQYFDSITCISVLEHVGLNNSQYTSNQKFHENNSKDYLLCIQDFHRILKSNGVCLITLPYGKHQRLDWLQIFDQHMVQELLHAFSPSKHEITYYKYDQNGWQVSTSEACSECTYTKGYPQHNYCVGAEAVVLIKMFK
ncbi:MAG: hypothetical protein KatS3mg087_0224 [Patescibacteria group bacterium]|nr:MAG: hypothetical protein KatS3mg087_0224 [Patescibacteria group bacterium]